MAEFLFSIDQHLFYFINGTLSNAILDVVMPFLTDLNKMLFGKVLAVILWIVLIWKGGRKGRIVAFMLVLLLVFSDQLSSTLIKKFIARPRPCHTFDGTPVLPGIRLLVDCGSGFSFPSSHAVNNFAAGSYFSYFYRKWTWLFFTLVAIIALSRVYVGVHYPSDIAGGAAIGTLCSAFVIIIWKMIAKRYAAIDVRDPHLNGENAKIP